MEALPGDMSIPDSSLVSSKAPANPSHISASSLSADLGGPRPPPKVDALGIGVAVPLLTLPDGDSST